MNDEPKNDDKDAFSRLLEVTYSSTADPLLYDDLVSVWERYMERTPNIDSNGPHLTHFNRALGIFAAMGRQRKQDSREAEMLESFSTPAILCTRDMRILRCNTAAEQLMSGRREASFPGAEDLGQALAGLNNSRRADIVPLQNESGQLNDCAIVSLQSSSDEGDDTGTARDTCLVVLTRPGGQYSPAWQRLTEQFGLSLAESEVLHLLVSGVPTDDIATQRAVSMNTVRTQIRRLLEKTGAGSLSDLIRHTLMICAQMETVSLAVRLAGQQTQDGARDLQSILTSDGRLLSFREMGDPNGRPMLFLHNMMGGTALPAAIQRTARARGWRIIAPSRPGFGASDSVGLKDMALVDRTAKDLHELLDHLGVPAALVLGLMSSAGLALRFAYLYPGRTKAVLNISHAAVMDDQMIAAMTNPSRTMATTYRRSALALRFLVRVAVASVDVVGPEHMVRRMLSQCPADAKLLEDPQTVQALNNMLQHTTVQGGEAFSKDGFVSLHNFRDIITALPPELPTLCLLGGQDVIYVAEQALRILQGVQGYPVEVIPDAGQYLFYSHFKTVFDRADMLLPVPTPMIPEQ